MTDRLRRYHFALKILISSLPLLSIALAGYIRETITFPSVSPFSSNHALRITPTWHSSPRQCGGLSHDGRV